MSMTLMFDIVLKQNNFHMVAIERCSYIKTNSFDYKTLKIQCEQ